MVVADAVVQSAIIANAAGSWKPGKGSHDCTFESGSIPGYPMKAFRIATSVSLRNPREAFELLFTTPNNNKLYETAVESEETIEFQDPEGGRLVHTRFGQQGIVSPRDFVTRNVFRQLDATFSTAAESLLQGELKATQGAASTSATSTTPAASGASAISNACIFVFASQSEEHHRFPAGSIPNTVRGWVYLHAFIGIPKAGGEFKLTYVSSVDPKGSLPSFAVESTFHENCQKVANIRTLLLLTDNLVENVKRVGKLSQIAPLSAASSSTPPHHSAAHIDPVCTAEGGATPVSKSSSVADRGVSVTCTTPLPAETAASFGIASPRAKEQLESLIQLHRTSQWVPIKALDNCLMEEAKTSTFPTTRKLIRISTVVGCSLGTLLEFLSDVSQVWKYDPNLETFEVLNETLDGSVIYSAYKRQTRFVEARDFNTRTTRAVLDQREADSFGLHGSRAVLVQSSVHSNEGKPPQPGITRGVVHVFGFIALVDEASDDHSCGVMPSTGNGGEGTLSTPSSSSASIKLFNILCVDPCGSIPNWIVDAANAESCKKLAAIRRLCEARHHATPGSAPRRLSLARRGEFASPMTSKGRTGADGKARAVGDDSGSGDGPGARDGDRATATASGSSAGSFHSCLDDDVDLVAEQENLKSFYETEVTEIIQHLVLLHNGKGWEVQKVSDDIKLETLMTPLCDKKAIKVSGEMKCSLETFRKVMTSLDFVRRYDPGLHELEVLESPPFGTVIYTNYKSDSRLVQPRDFCTITAAKLLSEDEGADAGLYTRGFRAAAYVISSIDSSDKPPQPGYVRGVVHAHGYIAVAVPPDAKRIRVFHIGLVDPCGAIPAKIVDVAMGDSLKQLAVLRGLCQAMEANGGTLTPAQATLITGSSAASSLRASAASAASLPAGEEERGKHDSHHRAHVEMTGAPAPSSAVGESGSSKKGSGGESSSPFPDVDEMPILRKLARVHSHTPHWQDVRNLGKIQVSWAPCDADPRVAVCRFATEFMCSLEAFTRLVVSSDFPRRCAPGAVDQVKFLEGPPNATTSYVSYRNSDGNKLFPGHDVLSLTVHKCLTVDEGADMGLYTKNIVSSAFISNATQWSRGVEPSKLYERMVVYYHGFVAVATPPTARRIRVFHYLAFGNVADLALASPGGKGNSRPKESIFVEVSKLMTVMMASAEGIQRDMDAALLPQDVPPPAASSSTLRESVIEDIHVTPFVSAGGGEKGAAVAPAQNEGRLIDAGALPSQRGSADSRSPAHPLPSTSASSVPATEPSGASPSAVSQSTTAVTPAQRKMLARLLELQRRKTWVMGKVVDGCLLETVAVDYCDKKAVRISTEFKCSLRTFGDFLSDVAQVRVLDPTLDKFDIVGETDIGTAIYTSYQQQSRLVAPRDFYTATLRLVLSPREVHEYGEPFNCPMDNYVLIQNSTSLAGRPPGGGKLVRGHVYTHGFIATAKNPDDPLIRVINISCVDPSGSIPNWIIDAVNAEACKKLAQMRTMCEERQKQRSTSS